MITVLLEQIIQLLKGWIDKFNDHAEAVEDSLTALNNTASDIELNTDPIPDIRDNTGAIITPITQIKTNTDSIKTDVTQIKTDTGIIKNNVNSIATSAGSAAAFAEDCATNTLDIVDKVTTIASDTTQIRADQITLDNDLDKIYNAIKWSCVNTIMTETESGTTPLTFNTDIADTLEALSIDIVGNQTGSGTPSPSNEMPITTYSNISLTVNGNNISVSLGNDVYSGYIDVITGKLTLIYDFYTLNGTEAWSVYSARNGFRLNTNNIISISASDNLCNRFIFSNLYTEFAIRVGDQGDRYYFCNILDNMPTITNLASWKTWLSNNNLQIASKLVTPIEITLSPETINTIIGNNIISNNINGDIEVTYKESVKHYLDKQDN